LTHLPKCCLSPLPLLSQVSYFVLALIGVFSILVYEMVTFQSNRSAQKRAVQASRRFSQRWNSVVAAHAAALRSMRSMAAPSQASLRQRRFSGAAGGHGLEPTGLSGAVSEGGAAGPALQQQQQQQQQHCNGMPQAARTASEVAGAVHSQAGKPLQGERPGRRSVVMLQCQEQLYLPAICAALCPACMCHRLTRRGGAEARA
jgi:hypothetical protein